MLGSFEEDDTSDERLAVLNAIAKTQHMIAQKRAEAALPLAGDVQFVEDVHRGGGRGGDSKSSAAVAMAHVKENRSEFFGHWSKKIEAFVSDQSKTALELPPQLSANDRRELHALADKFNLSHVSEGDGMDRHLVLRKDVLHYKAPHLRPSESQLDSLKQQQHSSRPKQNLGNSQQRTVESRFELRRAKRKDDDEPMYADDAAEKAIRRLQKATDHYRNAVEIGMTMEELSQLEQRPIEAVLAEEESKDRNAHPSNTTSSSQDVAAQQWHRVIQSGAGPSPHAPEELVGDDGRSSVAVEKVYDEQCLSCGTRTRLEYELAAWTCCGPCAVCRKETIFRLVEIKAEAEASRRRARSEDEDDEHRDTNGRRVDTSVDAPEPNALSAREDIDVSAPEEPMTLADTTDLLTMNDLPSGDVDTITRWARTFPGGDDTLHKYLFLIIDWSDLLDAGCSSFGRRSRPDTLYLRCTAIQNADGTPSVHATAILSEAMERCLSATTTGGGEETTVSAVMAAPDQRFRLALPSTSLYGAPLTVIARLDRVSDVGLDAALAQVKRKFGDAHFRSHRQLSALVSSTTTH